MSRVSLLQKYISLKYRREHVSALLRKIYGPTGYIEQNLNSCSLDKWWHIRTCVFSLQVSQWKFKIARRVWGLLVTKNKGFIKLGSYVILNIWCVIVHVEIFDSLVHVTTRLKKRTAKYYIWWIYLGIEKGIKDLYQLINIGYKERLF